MRVEKEDAANPKVFILEEVDEIAHDGDVSVELDLTGTIEQEIIVVVIAQFSLDPLEILDDGRDRESLVITGLNRGSVNQIDNLSDFAGLNPRDSG